MINTEKALSEMITILGKRGYTEDFNILEICDSYRADGAKINLNDLVTDKIYRFTGQHNADDEAILYAMHNVKDGAKGIFVTGYDIYADEEATSIIEKIQ